jgi:post-segregation antitoxin (ccd killing protein)
VKKRTTITLPDGVAREAKSLGINISGFAGRKLKEEINRIKQDSKRKLRGRYVKK